MSGVHVIGDRLSLAGIRCVVRDGTVFIDVAEMSGVAPISGSVTVVIGSPAQRIGKTLAIEDLAIVEPRPFLQRDTGRQRAQWKTERSPYTRR